MKEESYTEIQKAADKVLKGCYTFYVYAPLGSCTKKNRIILHEQQEEKRGHRAKKDGLDGDLGVCKNGEMTEKAKHPLKRMGEEKLRKKNHRIENSCLHVQREIVPL